ncbi:MAG TPA: glycosyltransferase [Bacteroidetes bacterium]|nr:glycosyltransferase [Bacteroidota bacterium]
MKPPRTDISIIIVNYNVKHFAEQCLRSVAAATGSLNVEVFLVDNGSGDGSVEYLRSRFPAVKIIDNGGNLGFGRANNIAFRQAKGRYLLVLNPDTLLGEDTLQLLVEYMDANPQVGAVGPKILTRDGSFDTTSKRSFPTPWVAFCRFSGLARLFPRSKLFGRYDLLYLDPDQPAEVDSLVGSCMMVRSEVYRQVGGFDEDYFMYGEDIDWCYRIKQAGWQIHFAPVTTIVHFRGESTRRSNVNRDRAFYGAMHLFVEKHFRGRYPLFTHRLIDFGILLAGTAAQIRRVWRRWVWPAFDWSCLFLVLWLARIIRWGVVELNLPALFAMVIQSSVWTASLAGFGAYKARRGLTAPLIWGMLLGFLVNSSFTYFFKQFAFSRFLNLFGLVVGGLLILGWRIALKKLRRTSGWRRFYQRRTLVVGVGENGRKTIQRIRSDRDLPYLAVGFIDPDESSVGSLIDDLPVLGCEHDISRLVQQEEIEEVLFAYEKVDHVRVLKTVGLIGKKRGVNFKIIAPESTIQPDGHIPLLSVDYLSPRGFGKSLRKITTLMIKR